MHPDVVSRSLRLQAREQSQETMKEEEYYVATVWRAETHFFLLRIDKKDFAGFKMCMMVERHLPVLYGVKECWYYILLYDMMLPQYSTMTCSDCLDLTGLTGKAGLSVRS